jgi:hypothetical protein
MFENFDGSERRDTISNDTEGIGSFKFTNSLSYF